MSRFREYQSFFTICVLVLILIVAVAVVSAFWPKYEERFFELGLLGEGKKAEDYYPSNDPNIGNDTSVRWYIYVHNHMGSAQNVLIRAKLLNSTLQGPDTSERRPSERGAFFEFPLALTTDETLLLPFFWRISEVIPRGDSIVITRLVVNNASLDLNKMNLNISAVSGYSFRMVFELWVYNEVSGDFEFSWKSKQESYCAWSQMWFKVKVDVAVTSVTPSPTEVTIGEPVTITVVVKNNGSVAETFNVTAYYNTTEIATQTVTNLAAGANKTLTFTWDTTGVAVGNYTIKAVAILAGDINTANNEKIDGQVNTILPE